MLNILPGSVLNIFFQMLAHLILIIATLWGGFRHLSHFKERGSKPQVFRNTQAMCLAAGKLDVKHHQSGSKVQA